MTTGAAAQAQRFASHKIGQANEKDKAHSQTRTSS